ncbi:MAG: Bug family tripartite tricarboxylate transporter substrate binding protein [Lautropia sp.]
MKRREFCVAATLSLACARTGHAADAADGYPNRPIRLVVGFPPGGGVDIIGRLIADPMSQQMGQPVVVENRPGANGNVALELTARSPGDGYSILIGGNGVATNSVLYSKAGYDLQRDFVAVAATGYAPLVIVVSGESTAKSLRNIVDMGRKPGTVTYATSGSGSAGHLASEMLKDAAKADFTHVPYKGGAPALVDLVANRVTFMLVDPGQAMPFIRSGKLRVLAIGGPTRSKLFPDVPTIAESGYPDVSAIQWWGVIAPAATPAPIVARLNSEINRALTLPASQARMAELGITAEPQTPQQFDALMKSTYGRAVDLVKRVGIRGE